MAAKVCLAEGEEAIAVEPAAALYYRWQRSGVGIWHDDGCFLAEAVGGGSCEISGGLVNEAWQAMVVVLICGGWWIVMALPSLEERWWEVCCSSGGDGEILWFSKM